MHQLIRPARAVVLVALTFTLALCGTASAAKLITGKQVKNGSLTSADIRSVNGDDVTDFTLTEADFAELVQGPRGFPGQEGPSGDQGLQGPPGASRLQYVVKDRTVAKESTLTWAAECPERTKTIGGGFSSGSPSWFWLLASAPDIGGGSWIVTAENTRNVALTGYAWAVCAATS